MTSQTLNEACIEKVTNFYEGGKGLRSKDLKNYTSGDHTNPGMENMVESLIWEVVHDLRIDVSRVKITQDYFNPQDTETEDPQRMDFHVKVDGEFPLIIESRAWIDKPFYTLKRAVTRNFMELDFVRERLADDVMFVYVGLAIDVKQRLINSLDKTMGYGDRVKMCKLSPYRRGYKGGNYFDHGVHKEGITEFIDIISKQLAPYTSQQSTQREAA